MPVTTACKVFTPNKGKINRTRFILDPVVAARAYMGGYRKKITLQPNK
ncbi:hypothetical protein OKW24_000761 [Peribacillus simplex]|nr:hypothetical protein [Peribacillus simplex]